MDIKKLSKNNVIMFKTTKGKDAIGKITSIEGNFILMHNMILLDDFSKLRGRFGGLNIHIDQVLKIIK